MQIKELKKFIYVGLFEKKALSSSHTFDIIYSSEELTLTYSQYIGGQKLTYTFVKNIQRHINRFPVNEIIDVCQMSNT